MKRLTAIILICLLLSGCGNGLKEPVTFYYLNANYEETMSSVIGSEQREASGHAEDLAYLMALYLMGPASEDLQSPLPQGVHMFSIEHRNSAITLRLSSPSTPMTDAQYTLAFSCLSMTCLEITGAESITISCGDRTMTLSASDLLLQDLITAGTEESQ